MPLHKSRYGKILTFLWTAAALVMGGGASAVHANNKTHTPFITGPLGLNTIPTARMDQQHTVRAGVSTLDPYAHSFIGIQLAAPLHINLRQTAEVSNITEDADRLYPGVDLKLRLVEEGPITPEISLGLQSAIGHKRMAGEYVALSKRYNNLDFTLGMGWGRLGSAAHFDNPFKIFGDHFREPRPFDGEMPNDPSDWFTGEDVGLFGGIEYFTPIDNVSLKIDYAADRYVAEHVAFGYKNPPAWSVGISYKPFTWMSTGIGLQGTEKLMGRVSIEGTPADWPFSRKSYQAQEKKFYKTDIPALLDHDYRLKIDNDISLTNTELYENGTLKTDLWLSPHAHLPKQLGRSVTQLSKTTGRETNVNAIEFQTISLGLRGPSIKLLYSDVEKALNGEQYASPQEIWQNAEITQAQISLNDNALKRSPFLLPDIWLVQENQFSLSEEDNGVLYRSSLKAEARIPLILKSMTLGGGLRFNLTDNLDKIEDIRPRATLPVRSDIYEFADKTLSLDNLYVAHLQTIYPEVYLSVAGGYLEEMYAGIGGEILYRPFKSRFAFGAELWQAMKRDPDTKMNTGLNGDHLLTGHVNAWYDIPNEDITLFARAGRYLAEDVGVSAGLQKEFKNGAALQGFVTVTNYSDFDLFGGTTHAFHGVSLSLPLGSVDYVPDGSHINITAQPFGRDIGQSIKKPINLFATTDPFTLDHMTRYWNHLIE